jgi:hypothetical protein
LQIARHADGLKPAAGSTKPADELLQINRV